MTGAQTEGKPKASSSQPRGISENHSENSKSQGKTVGCGACGETACKSPQIDPQRQTWSSAYNAPSPLQTAVLGPSEAKARIKALKEEIAVLERIAGPDPDELYELHLTPREMSLLDHFITIWPRYTTISQIEEFVFADDWNGGPTSNTIGVHLFKLRNKMVETSWRIVTISATTGQELARGAGRGGGLYMLKHIGENDD